MPFLVCEIDFTDKAGLVLEKKISPVWIFFCIVSPLYLQPFEGGAIVLPLGVLTVA